MKVSKTKYTVEFTEETKKAILTICNMVDSLYEDDLCTDLECENCPFHHNFCISGGTDDSRINSLKQKIERFLNETD